MVPISKMPWLSSCLLLINFASIGLAEQEDCLPSWRRNIEFIDDFGADSRPDYEISGAVDWQLGNLTLKSPSSVAKKLEVGPAIEIRLRLFDTDMTADRPKSETLLVLRVDGGSEITIVIGRDAGPRGRGEVRVVTSREDEEGGQRTRLVRRFEIPTDPFDSQCWRIRYHYGMVQLNHGETSIGMCYSENDAQSVTGVSLSQLAGRVSCRSLRIIAIRQPAFTTEELTTLKQARALQLEGWNKTDQGEYDMALRLSRRSVELLRIVHGTRHPEVAQVLHNLGIIHHKLGDSPSAQSAFESALVIRKQILGTDHMRTSHTLDWLGQVATDRGDFGKAHGYYEHALRIDRRALGEIHAETARLTEEVGWCLIELGRRNEALPHLSRFREIKRALYSQVKTTQYDFGTDIRKEFAESKGVEWQAGQLALTPGALLSWQLPWAYAAELSANLEFAPLRETDAAAETRVTFTQHDGVSASVSFRQKLDEGKAVGEIRISSRKAATGLRGLFGGTTEHIHRTIAVPDGIADGWWTVRYRLGALEVDYAGRRLASGFIDEALSMPLASVSVAQQSSGSLIRGMRTEVNVEPAITLRQGKRFFEATQTMQNMLTRALVGRFRAASDSGDETLRRLRESVGDRHDSTISHLGMLGVVKREMGDHAAAHDCFQRAFDNSRALAGEDHPITATALTGLAGQLVVSGEYDEARQHCEAALRIREKFLGTDHTETANAHFTLGSVLAQVADFDGALQHLLMAIEIYERVGHDRRNTHTALNNLGEIYRQLANFDEAEKYYRKALTLCERLNGRNHYETAATLANLGVLLAAKGDFKASLSHLEEALQICRKTVGNEGYCTMVTLGSLSEVLRESGDFKASRERAEEALMMSEKAFGEEHPFVAAQLGNYGHLLMDEGNYAAAQSYLERSLGMRIKLLGPQHPEIALSHSNLSSLFHYQGDIAAAVPHAEKALAIYENLYRRPHPDIALVLSNLGVLHFDLENLEKAAALLERALVIDEEVLGDKHPHVAIRLNNLGILHLSRGRLDQAEKHYRRAYEILRGHFGDNHSETARELNNLAHLFELKGDLETARDYGERALAAYKNSIGETHGEVAAVHHNLSIVLQKLGQQEGALEHARQAYQIRLNIARDLVPVMAETTALIHIRQLLYERDMLLARLRSTDDSHAAYEAVWQSKAFVSRSLARRDFSESPQAQRAWDRLCDTRRQLARWTFATVAPALAKQRKEQLDQLSQQKEILERELAVASESFAREKQSFRAASSRLHLRLPAETAVVDIVGPIFEQPSHTPVEGRTLPEPTYEAFVLTHSEPDDEPALQWIHLGAAKPIDEAIHAWRRELASEMGRGLTDLDASPPSDVAPADQLRRLVWEKINPHLRDCSTVVMIPDGELSKLPWSALPGREAGTFLIEDLAIATANSSQQVCELLSSAVDKTRHVPGKLLLVGGVAYDAAPVSPPASRPVSRPALLHAGGAPQWKSLPGTLAEVSELADAWKQLSPTEVLTNESANESTVADLMPQSRFVHLATHAFFADPSFRSALQLDGNRDRLSRLGIEMRGERSTLAGRNPLLLSGIVLAGANQPNAEHSDRPVVDDGIMTAEEIINLDLRDTELVVLSACDTSLGERLAGGEGLFGLQRAFALAGARTTVSSLWRVDDSATKTLMVEFYRNLATGESSKLEALRQAQITMLKRYDVAREKLATLDRVEGGNLHRTRPAYWAAFLLSGDWR